jgi:TLD
VGSCSCLFFCLKEDLLVGLVFRFLWRYVEGKLDVYNWTGKNDYVALCEPEYLSFGGGCVHFLFLFYLLCLNFEILNRDGRYGLYLDDTLLDGSSARCPTFENEPLCSPGMRKGGNVTFECVGLEVWAVGPT